MYDINENYIAQYSTLDFNIFQLLQLSRYAMYHHNLLDMQIFYFCYANGITRMQACFTHPRAVNNEMV